MSQVVTICSIYFRELVATRPYSVEGHVVTTPQPDGRAGGFQHTFIIPAAAPGRYQTLDIREMFELQRDGSRDPYATKVYPDGPGGIAEDLVREWRDYKAHSDVGRPGIFVCAKGRVPTEEELEPWRLTQTALCEALCGEAEDYSIRGAQTLIHAWHRDAAKWLGRLQYKWLHLAGQVMYKECPMCAQQVDTRAARCQQCGAIFDFERVEKYETERLAFEARIETARLAALKSIQPEPRIAAK